MKISVKIHHFRQSIRQNDQRSLFMLTEAYFIPQRQEKQIKT